MRSLGFDVVSWNEAVRDPLGPLMRPTLPDPSSARGTEELDVVVLVVVVLVVLVVVVAAPCTASTRPNQLFPCALPHVTA